MRVYGDLLRIESGFITLKDVNIQYYDIYGYDGKEGAEDGLGRGIYDKWASFVDEYCQIWEVIDHLETIGYFTGYDVVFWECDDEVCQS